MARARLGSILHDFHTLFGRGTATGLEDAQLLERFAADGDEVSFAALVARHGPMVLAVCQGVLRCPHDVEDAFQATFLILARKASTLRRAESLGGWLHRVAGRAAARAAADSARRRSHEARAAVAESRAARESGPWNEVLSILHEELARLPEKYRVPLVLCELESFTREQAARQLGWPPGTVAGRLARGRDLLHARLSRRGVAPAALALSLMATRKASAALPPAWAMAAYKVASGVAPGRPVEILAEEALGTLARSGTRPLARIGLASCIALAALAAALVWAGDRGSKDEPTLAVAGLVVDPDGRPAAGVAVYASRKKWGDWDQVTTEVRTDGQGRFRLTIPTAHSRPGPVSEIGAIWAYQPGSLMAAYEVNRGNVHDDVPLRLALGPPAMTSVEVRDPEGKPVAGAKVMPRVLTRDHLSVPVGLAERVAADTVTDARGRASVTAFLPEEMSTVFVTARGFGTQQFGFSFEQRAPLRTKVIHLMTTGRIEGRVVGRPEAIRGLRLTVAVRNTWSNPPPPPALGFFHVTTDAEGRFVIPEAPEGDLEIQGHTEVGALVVHSPTGLKVEAKKTTPVEVELRDAVRVHGVVREKGTGKPIPGTTLGPIRGGEGATSDASGRFTFYTRPGSNLSVVRSVPEGYAPLVYGLSDIRIPEDAAEFELPPVELARARTVSGLVRDEGGRPVPGATVSASWQVDEGPMRQGPWQVSVTTDGVGEFSFLDLPAYAAVSMSAAAPGIGRTLRPVIARPGEGEKPTNLTLDPARAIGMKGRVVNAQEKPLPGARVRLRSRGRPGSFWGKVERPVDFAGTYVLRTDADGRFETPRGLDVEGTYSAIAEADGYTPGQTPWTTAAEGAFAELVLRPERDLP